LFVAFRLEKIFAWPKVIFANLKLQTIKQLLIARQITHFHEIGGDGDVVFAKTNRLFNGPHAMADF